MVFTLTPKGERIASLLIPDETDPKRYISDIREDFYSGHDFCLVLGDDTASSFVFNGVLASLMADSKYLCMSLDGGSMKTPWDLAEFILKKRYPDNKSLFDRFNLHKEKYPDHYMDFSEKFLAEPNSENPLLRKIPVLFIDGIENMFFNFDFSHVSESSKQEFLQEMQKIIGFSSRLPFLTMIGNDLIMSNKDLQDPKTGENPDPDLIVFNYHDAVFSSVKKIHSPAGFAHSFRYFRETKINPCLHDGRLLFAVIGRVKNFGLEYLATLENPKYPLNTIDFYLTSVKKNKHLFEPKN